MAPPAFFLRNVWYYALPSFRLKKGQMLAKTLLGEPVVFCRDAQGKAFALRDICPHRGIPLSDGKFDGGEIECCYHGWRFNGEGTCTCIPSLTGQEGIEPKNIQVRRYPVREAQGNIWIYMAEGRATLDDADLPEIPPIPGIADDARAGIVEVMMFPSHIDHAVIGLMDPAHGPFVHKSWWWRTPKSIHEKAKAFGPSRHGFTMLRHAPSKNSAAYKILGGKPETEISFRLPGVRLEHIKVGDRVVVNFTTVTPLTETETEITHSIYWTIPWLTLFRPIARPFVRRFLGQDRDVVVKQQAGLKHEQNLLLIRDADAMARWYYQLKNEYARSQEEGRDFNNPVRECVLRWRS